MLSAIILAAGAIQKRGGAGSCPHDTSSAPYPGEKNLPSGCIVLDPDIRLTCEAVVEAPISRASVGQLVHVLAFDACLGAEPSEMSLPPHTSNVNFRSPLDHA